MKTNKTTAKEAAKSIVRITMIVAAAAVGTFGLMATLYDDSPRLITDLCYLALAAGGWGIARLLYAKWSKIDKWLAAYDRSCDEALDATNPIYIDEEDDQR